jgi:hypothetical protein
MDSIVSGEVATGAQALWGLVASDIRLIAQRAVALWTEVRTALDEHTGSELFRSQAQSPVAQQFHTELGVFFNAVYARDDSGRLPTAPTYHAHLHRAYAPMLATIWKAP